MTCSVRYGALLICALALAACDRDRATDRDRTTKTDPGTTTVTGANVVANDPAVLRVVNARCARELACNNVGADKKFASTDVCAQKLRADMKNDLNVQDCPRGIDQKELDECLSEIRNESCNNPIDKLERLAACSTSDLCLKR